MRRRKPAKRTASRQGAAIVELAICLPLLVLVTLATIEACGMLYLKQSTKIAAYESARVGLVPTAKAENVDAQARLILDGRKVKNYTITMTPGDPTTMERGDYFRVEITADCGPNSLIGAWFYEGKQVTEAVEMVAE